jgi:hypothetical protein
MQIVHNKQFPDSVIYLVYRQDIYDLFVELDEMRLAKSAPLLRRWKSPP